MRVKRLFDQAWLVLAAGLIALPAAAATADSSVNYSTYTVEQLRELAKTRDVDAILDLGERRDQGAADILVPLAQGPRSVTIKRAKVFWASRCALAKIGVAPYLDELMAGLASRNPKQRAEYLSALGWVGDPRAAKSIGPILLEKGGPPSKTGSSTWAGLAAEALGEIFPEVQVHLMLQDPGNRDRIKQWRRWWLEVREKDPSQYDGAGGEHQPDTESHPIEKLDNRQQFK
jgi:HEAT repeat protein